jgi:methionine aminopeptidase
MPDLTDDIETAAAKPKAVTIDGNTVTAHSLPELVEADKHLKADDSVNTQTSRGIRWNKFKPPGGGL